MIHQKIGIGCMCCSDLLYSKQEGVSFQKTVHLNLINSMR